MSALAMLRQSHSILNAGYEGGCPFVMLINNAHQQQNRRPQRSLSNPVVFLDA